MIQANATLQSNYACCVSGSVMSDSLQLHGLHSLLGSSVHGILQARILECVAMSSPGDLPNPEIEPRPLAL